MAEGGEGRGKVRRWHLLLGGAASIILVAVICGAVIGRRREGGEEATGKGAASVSPTGQSSSSTVVTTMMENTIGNSAGSGNKVFTSAESETKPATVTVMGGEAETKQAQGQATAAPAAPGKKPPFMPFTLVGEESIPRDADRAEEGGADIIARLGDGQSTCIAESGDDIYAAVADETCESILLLNNTANAYTITEEVVIDRPVVITGNPLTLPMINASEAERAFHVVSGGFLDLRFVRVTRGKGVMRRRYSPDGALSPLRMVVETRGGNVLVDWGALGSSFQGVHFIYYDLSPTSVASAILATAANIGLRVYGGAVLVMAGETSFVNCHFRSLTILTPLADNMGIGGLFMMVAGTVSFTGCSFTNAGLFTVVTGAGLDIAVLGGAAIFTWCAFNAAVGAVAATAAGFSVFVGGGVLIITGCTSTSAFGALASFGFGNVLATAGVLVMTGFTSSAVYGVLTAMGCGFYFSVGAGVFIQSGLVLSQVTGVSYSAQKGGINFVGAGTAIVTGSALALSAGHDAYTGHGPELYNGAGYVSIVGGVTATAAGTFFFAGFGGRFSVAAGHMTLIEDPVALVNGLVFLSGYGSAGFVGAGSAVLGLSPIFVQAGLVGFTPGITSYWIEGKNDALGFGVPEYVGKRSLEGGPNGTTARLTVFDMSAPDDGMTTAIPSWVPSDLQRAAASIQSAKAARADPNKNNVTVSSSNGENAAASSWPPVVAVAPGPTFMVNSALEECTVCNSGDVGGAGQASCTVSDTCGSSGRGNGSYNATTVEYTEHRVLFGTIMLATHDATTPHALAVRDALQSLVLANRTHTGVQVSVWRDLGAPFVSDHSPGTDDGHGLETYQVAFVTTSEDDADAITKGLTDGEDGSQPRLLQGLVTYFKEEEHAIGDVAVSCCTSLQVPSYSSLNFSRDTTSSSSPPIGVGRDRPNAIVIVEQGHEAVPVSSVARLHTYLIHLSGFPLTTKVKVTLVRAAKNNSNGWLPNTTPLGTPTTDDQGEAEVVWRVPALQPKDRYYVRAQVARAGGEGGQFGMSSAFQVVQEPNRRKLGSLRREVPL